MLVEAFDNPYTSRDRNIHFNGATYRCVKADQHSIYATKVGTSNSYYNLGGLSTMKH